ncbi:hypothetical protein GIB67_007334 [Kingdonia uniflora]|uniref:Small ribosomal subunit protein mS23 n=1 Tax=Kingdonia uniflora TaxID=39325 RepID=A0A7J7NXK2_9MAGN|nr:hypothetical protein GIB67_007334 [Kingdonia uniflora]
MSFMRGDLLTRTRKLVQGFAKAKPKWLNSMEEAPPVSVARVSGKIQKASVPEDVYAKKFLQRYPESLHEDSIRITGIAPPSARVFGWRVLELKEFGVGEDEAISVAFLEYRAEKKEKKAAYRRLKEIARIEGTRPPPNPFPPSPRKLEGRKYANQRPIMPKVKEIMQKMKDERTAEMQDRWLDDGFNGRPRESVPLPSFEYKRTVEMQDRWLDDGFNGRPRESVPLPSFEYKRTVEMQDRWLGGFNGRPRESVPLPSFEYKRTAEMQDRGLGGFNGRPQESVPLPSFLSNIRN